MKPLTNVEEKSENDLLKGNYTCDQEWSLGP